MKSKLFVLSSCLAASTGRLRTSGTRVLPLASTRLTVVPGFADVPAAGVWLSTVLAAFGTSWVDVRPRTRFARANAAFASDSVVFVRSGIWMACGPVDTVMVTELVRGSEVPAGGLSLTTKSFAMVGLGPDSVFTTKPASVRAVVAAAVVRPTTAGTGTLVDGCFVVS